MYVACASRTMQGARRIAAQRGLSLPAPVVAPEQQSAPVGLAVASPTAVSNVVQLFPTAIQRMNVRGMPAWAREIVIHVAAKRDVSPDDIKGRSRVRNVVAARNEAFYLLKIASSPITGLTPSYPQIALWFGRDHTGVLFGASKHAAFNGLKSPSSFDAVDAAEKNRERHRAIAARKRGAL